MASAPVLGGGLVVRDPDDVHHPVRPVVVIVEEPVPDAGAHLHVVRNPVLTVKARFKLVGERRVKKSFEP